jgi:hypothetical protein
MGVRPIHAVVASLLLASAFGCHKNGHDPKYDTATPEELCQVKCQLEAAPACPRMPADFEAFCETLCLAGYSDFPECTDILRRVHICAIEEVHYGCDSSGILLGTPQGACAVPGADCLTCTQSLFDCM